MFVNNERYRTKGWIICDNKGYPFGLVCLRSVFGSECFGTCDVVNTLYFLVKGSQVVPRFVKICFKFSSVLCESVVRKINMAKSKTQAGSKWNSSLSVFRMT